MNFKPIETERLILRAITEFDLEDFYELDSNPKVHQFLGNRPVKTLDESKAIITNILEQYQANDIGRLAIINKATKEFMGWSGLKYEEKLRKEFNYYDLGYRLKEQYWGKGYATEAALASLKYGFEDLQLKEISAAADVNNIASNAILKKIGLQAFGSFTYKGHLCNWYTLPNPSL